MTFFVDNNLSPKLAEGMRGFGEAVTHITEQLAHDAADTDVLAHVGTNSGFLVTRDLRIRNRGFRMTLGADDADIPWGEVRAGMREGPRSRS